MKIKKGTIVIVNHSRKGKFVGEAIKDFDTDEEEFYPIKVAKGNGIVEGISSDWLEGDEIPCRKRLCTIEVVK